MNGISPKYWRKLEQAFQELIEISFGKKRDKNEREKPVQQHKKTSIG